MAILVVDGFDAYTYVEPLGEYSMTISGWGYSKGGGSSQMELLPGPVTGKVLRMRNYYNTRVRVDKALPDVIDLSFGCLIKCVGSVGGQLSQSVISARSSSTGSRVAVDYVPSTSRFVLVSDTSSDEATSSIAAPVGTAQYLEVTISGDTAELFVNGASQGTITIGSVSPLYDSIALEVYHGATNTSYYNDFHFDDLYVTDNVGPDLVGRLGPIALIPMQPTSDGVVYTDFTAEPVGPKFSTIDDTASSGDGDQSTYVSSDDAGHGQTFKFTAEADFPEALGFYTVAGTGSDFASGLALDAIMVADDSSGEADMGGMASYIGDHQISRSAVQTTLPGGVALTKANLEDTEFGFKTRKFVP